VTTDEVKAYKAISDNLNAVVQSYRVAAHALAEERDALEILKGIKREIQFSLNFLRHRAEVVSIFEIQKIRYDQAQLHAKIRLKERIIVNLMRMMTERVEEIQKCQLNIVKILYSTRRGTVLDFKR
jgi:hypothetical protein